jgi:hypothetical protein
MSAPRDYSPVGIHSSITSYKEARPHPQALRKRNIIVPPLYFGMVAPKIYRRYKLSKSKPRLTRHSGHPLQLNFPFLDRLHLKTIMFSPSKSPR